LTLYELQAAIFFRVKLQIRTKCKSQDELETELEEILSLLNEVNVVLGWDPPFSDEGIIASSIPQSIVEVKSLKCRLLVESKVK